MIGFFAYTMLLLAVATLLPPVTLQPGAEQFILVVGGLALWRYSWGLVHYARHWIYRRITFPRLRRKADSYAQDFPPPHIYFLITSYRIETQTSISVYRAAMEEAITCGIPAKIVASLVEKADEMIVQTLFAALAPPAHVSLKILRIPGSGKRDGLAQGFRAISRDMPHPDAVVAVIDGDSIIGPGLVRACVPFFHLRPHLGALTTDEICDVRGSKLIRNWHELRFAQRQILMSSIALSRKVLTLTGRMSMFRASIITDPGFIAQVEHDSLDHWRLGRFKFLTGDDKSTWFWVLKQGWEMLYVPDVAVRTVEHPPSRNFFKATTQLIFRWSGNMLRTNGRAIKVGPRRAGFFPWWCLVDQRISMWTALAGPVFALFLAIEHGAVFIFIYLVWIGFTRWVMSLMIFAVRGQVSWTYPFLIYYNQIWGSLIKTYVFFRLDRQSWTRQKTRLPRGLNVRQKRMRNFSSAFSYSVAMLVFVCAVGLLSGALKLKI
ncbi:MAG: glycosyltransferase family 2 protein [Alphaproteobacteria bacterium]